MTDLTGAQQAAEIGRRVLEALREGALGCLTCGRRHEYRVISGVVDEIPHWSWADPTDGHVYRRMNAEQILAWLDSNLAEAVVERAAAT